ncbi:hypothetical protein ACBJ59_10955 [Nonomuraea sp. MTCD27]|uniref:hypothetical protein n=1 Tax=Nonomuraea sp. MTCD27 TaxID=1676747 RepID=UPI0035C110D9
MGTHILITAPVAVALAAAAVGQFVVRPALRRRRQAAERQQTLRRTLRDQVICDLQQQRADDLAAHVQRERTRGIDLTVDLLYASRPGLWDEFVAGHTKQPRGGAR